MLFLRLDQALQLERSAYTLKERLVVRYPTFNGLSPMEIAAARIEHLDPVECLLFLPRRHWKRNCVVDIDRETVRLQIVYSGARKKGPLIRSKFGGHLSRNGVWWIVKTVARRTSIPNAEKISPLVLKRTFAREWLRCGGNVGTLKQQFSHLHLEATARYLRFLGDDVRRNHDRLMRRVKLGQETEPLRQVS